jgi:hypothetical protein
MPRTSLTPLEDLRLTIECLPVRTREAMLEGVRANEIITGAYVDRDGAICPMLAAHRHGGRTNFLSFARAWDRYASPPRLRKSRKATRREIRELVCLLEASLNVEPTAPSTLAVELAQAITEHQHLARRRAAREALGSEPVVLDEAISEHQQLARERRGREAVRSGGWDWLLGGDDNLPQVPDAPAREPQLV